MTISKKLFFMLTAAICTSLIESHSLKPNVKGYLAIAGTAIVTGPCVLVNGVKNLSFAKALQNELKNPQILAPSLEEMAHSLKKRGRNGLFLGTILSLPIPFFATVGHQMDQNGLAQEVDGLAEKNRAMVLDAKP